MKKCISGTDALGSWPFFEFPYTSALRIPIHIPLSFTQRAPMKTTLDQTVPETPQSTIHLGPASSSPSVPTADQILSSSPPLSSPTTGGGLVAYLSAKVGLTRHEFPGCWLAHPCLLPRLKGWVLPLLPCCGLTRIPAYLPSLLENPLPVFSYSSSPSP